MFALAMIFFGGLWLGVKKLWNKEKDWLDVLFSLGIFLILCVPVTRINRAAISQTENRVWAVFPRLFTSEGWINTKFGQEFDSYFNDRFRGRGFLLRNYQKLNAKINTFKVEYYLGSAVVEGEDGWYFYCLKNSLRNFQNLDVFTEQEMRDALQRLKKIDTWCKMHGIKFYYFIAPDKNKVYGEYLKAIPKTYPDSRSRAALWVDYVKKNSDIKILYPLEELKKERNNALLYYKLDTHWNFMGAYLGYGELMNVIKKDFPDLPEFKAVSYLEQKEYNGDLYMLAPNIVKKDHSIYQYPNLPSQFFKDTSLQIPYRLVNPFGKYKVFFMRDSFCNGMLPFFHYSFQDIYASWQFAMKNEDLTRLISEKTDIVILEHVERNLPTAAKELQYHSSFETNH
jgi:hypothetical protein